MMTTSKINSAAGASKYLTDDNFAQKSTAAGEYYTSDGDVEAAQFHGKLAADYGLDGQKVDKKQLNQILSGVMPDGTILPGAAKRTPGWEMTFSAPKSVSIAGLVLQDESVIKAHDAAVAATLAHVEREHMITRIKTSGKERLQRTDNMFAATFRHDTNRELEPQLHTHSVIFNATKTDDGQIRSIYSKPFFSQQKELGEHYRRELAANLKAAGYEIRDTEEGGRWSFELSAVKVELMQEFSSRSAQIEAHLAANGLTRETATAAQIDTAALATRKDKVAPESREQLQQQWRDVASIYDQAHIERKELAHEERAAVTEKNMNEVLRSVEHLSEREARPSVNALEQHLKKRDVELSRTEINEVLAQLEQRGDLKRVETVEFDKRTKQLEVTAGFVTKNNVDKDLQLQQTAQRMSADKKTSAGEEYKFSYARKDTIVQQSRTTAGQTKSILSAQQAADAVAMAEKDSAKHGHAWNEQQRAATLGILSNETRLHVVQGLAGTAKTSTVLKTVALQAQRQNREMVAVAPSQSATQKLADETGIKDARNLSKVLADAKDFDERSAKKMEALAKQQQLLDTKIERLQAIQRDAQAAGYERIFGNKQRQNAVLAGESTANLGQNETFRNKKGELVRIKTSKNWRGQEEKTYENAGVLSKLAASAVGAGLKKQAETQIDELLKQRNELAQKQAELAAEIKGQSSKIYVVDEASLASTQQLDDLFKHAERTGATVILTGDTKQHGSVDAGRAFEAIQEAVREKGGKVYEMDTILRQKNEILKEAINEAVAGRVDQALNKIEESGGKITQEADDLLRAKAIAKDYTTLSDYERKKTIVVDPSNASREILTREIREQLKQQGKIGREEITVKKWRSDSLTQAEKRYADSYKDKQVRIDRPSALMRERGIKSGDILHVQAINAETQTVRINNVDYSTSELQQTADVGKLEVKNYAQNDAVVLNLKTDDAAKIGVIKGETATVTAFKYDVITLKTENGKELKITKDQAKDLDHAYVQTSHKAQGQTQKRAIVNLSSKSSYLSNQQTLYVAASRATHDVRIYTDNREALVDQIQARHGQKTRANENHIRFEKVQPIQQKQQQKIEIQTNSQSPTIKQSRPKIRMK